MENKPNNIIKNHNQSFIREHKTVIIFLITAILTMGGIGVWKFTSNTSAQPQYQTTTAEKGTLITSVSASGTITAENSASITANVGGYVSEVYVKAGDKAAQGQLIATITLDESSQQKQVAAWSSYLGAQNSLTTALQSKLTLEQSIEQDKNALITAQQNAIPYENYDPTDPAKQKINSTRRAAELALQVDQQKLTAADATIAKAQNDINSALLSYNLTLGKITAPITGVISSLDLSPGLLISNSSTTQQELGLITANEGSTKATVNLSEVDSTKVTSGQKATITLTALTGKTFTGRVTNIDTAGSVSSGVTTYPATIIFDSAEGNIYPNMSVDVQIITSVKDSVVLIPSSAIQTVSGQSTVRVLKNDVLTTPQVETGSSNDTQTEIVSGINEGDIVVTGITSGNQSQTSTSSPFNVFGGNRNVGGGQMMR